MLKLQPLTTADKNRHFDLMDARFHKGLEVGLSKLKHGDVFNNDLIDFLKSVLKEVLVGTPAELESIALGVTGLFPEFSKYAASKRKNKIPGNEIHQNTLMLIERCFDYEFFSLKSAEWNAYALVRAHNLRICPYCHAHHINYYINSLASTPAEQYRIRPPLDHFLPKSLYPYLAVSLHNLVPSCAQCNSSIKSSDDPLSSGITNPHDASTTLDIRFSAIGSIPAALGGTIEDIQISLATTSDPSAALAEVFLLRERYQWYRHEVKDLIDRYAEHLAMPLALRAVVSRERFVLGCSRSKIHERAIGFCLNDIYQELVSQKVA